MSDKNKVVVELSEEQLESMGTGTLGYYAMEESENPEDEELVISFPETTMDWKRSNGGPKSMIFSENVLPCLTQSLVKMIDKFKDVSIDTHYIEVD